jgi:hypothetical protein
MPHTLNERTLRSWAKELDALTESLSDSLGVSRGSRLDAG